jgi:hypothetical protein
MHTSRLDGLVGNAQQTKDGKPMFLELNGDVLFQADSTKIVTALVDGTDVVHRIVFDANSALERARLRRLEVVQLSPQTGVLCREICLHLVSNKETSLHR